MNLLFAEGLPYDASAPPAGMPEFETPPPPSQRLAGPLLTPLTGLLPKHKMYVVGTPQRRFRCHAAMLLLRFLRLSELSEMPRREPRILPREPGGRGALEGFLRQGTQLYCARQHRRNRKIPCLRSCASGL